MLHRIYHLEKLSQLSTLPINHIHSYQHRLADKLTMVDYAELVQKSEVPMIISLTVGLAEDFSILLLVRDFFKRLYPPCL